MKKVLGICLVLALAVMLVPSAVFAVDPPPGVVIVHEVGLNGGTVGITTVTPYVQDTFSLTTATGSFGVDQVSRFVATGPYTGDGNDIDRSATFVGTGSINTVSNYASTVPYSVGSATLTSAVTATGAGAAGALHQNLAFDQNNGGVYTQSQWAKQRDMQIEGYGDYYLDVNNTGMSLTPSLSSLPSSGTAYSFDINSDASAGQTLLLFAPTLATTGYEALSNNADHGQYTGVSLNFILQYLGSPVIKNTVQFGNGEVGGYVDQWTHFTGTNYAITENFITKTITGYGIIK